MNKNDIKIILHALNNAISLISEEYQSLTDADLKEKYEETMSNIEKAVELLRINYD